MKQKPKDLAAERQIEHWPVDRVIPYQKNARTHSEAQVDEIAASIKEFGWTNPILVDSEGVSIAGEGRQRAAKKMGLETVPVIVLHGLTDAQKRALRLADNQLALNAGWDDALLAAEIQSLKLDEYELSVLGFTEAALDELLASVGGGAPAAPEAQIDRADELREKWKTERAQLWLIGKHRLLCGDSTNADDVKRLFGSAKAFLLASDPPFGVAYGKGSGPESAKRFTAMSGDDLEGAQLQTFLQATWSAALPHLEPNAAWYIWHASTTQGYFAAAAAAAQLLIHRQIIWAKSHFILGHGDFHQQHELCFYGWRQGHRARWFGDRCQSTLWAIENPRAADAHPTQKPVEIFARPMKFNTKPGEICYEPFAGSGTQFVAAEQLKRICYGMEIEPKYVAVCLQRLADMGLKPVLEAAKKSAPRKGRRRAA